MPALRGAAGIGAAAVLVLTSGCGMLGIGGEEPESEEDRLVAMLNESFRIEGELMAAEFRIVQNCLEDEGFTVHDAWSMMAYQSPKVDSLTSYYPHEQFLIDPEEAAEYGFGQWANSPDGWEDPSAEDYYASQEEKWEDDGWEDPDNSEFEALPPAEQYAWYVAYQGAEYVEMAYGTESEWVEGFEGDYSEGEEFDEEELPEGELPEGEIDFEEESWEEPKPGGCQLEMIEALYGEPRLVEETWEGEGESSSYSYWTYRPQNPAENQESMWEDIEFGYTDSMADLQYEFLDCLAEKGLEDWEFDEYNGLPIWEFFAEIYYQNASDFEQERMMWGDSSVDVPPVPDDVGDSYEEWKAFEIQTAQDFADCGDQTGYAEASEKAYKELHFEAYKAIEEDTYSWQQDMNEYLSKAQELLDA
ncbi:hypothetical protein [Glycomyces sp. NRRL B-16210]|uniref:hypothetical protein n=1 Tax=Glycomyces sp. NRRL B-16210 TaxID=1463821 RepID=UPI00105D992E|nr:hypothetical protein [Glycomyces sp. NRRL B-16210]